MDVFTPEKRSEVMSRIRGRDTKPELALRSMLHRLGYRFTIKGPKNRSLPGKPDIVLPKHRTVIFVHGCFWHGHENCPAFRLPKTRSTWWKQKITGNQQRDLRHENALRLLGWNVVTIWECALKRTADHPWLIKRLPALLGSVQRSPPIASRNSSGPPTAGPPPAHTSPRSNRDMPCSGNAFRDSIPSARFPIPKGSPK